MPRATKKAAEPLNIDTITREQIIELIDKENKRKEQVKENFRKYNEKLREKGELQQKRAEYKMNYYRKKVAKEAETAE